MIFVERQAQPPSNPCKWFFVGFAFYRGFLLCFSPFATNGNK